MYTMLLYKAKNIFLLIIFFCLNQSIPLLAQSKPNIVLIVADDLGFSDLGCYGSEIKTPHLDLLAKEGMRLTQCYTNGICAPSRASLLTGQYPHNAGIGFFNTNLGTPAYQGYLNASSLTLGEVLRSGGYQTFLSGKWHVGNDSTRWPLQRGFNQFFGFIPGAISYFDTKNIIKGNTQDYLVDQQKKYHPTAKDFYLTDELTRRGIHFLAKRNSEHKTPVPSNTSIPPFFLYLAYSSPHWPLHALPQDIAKYKGIYDLGWDSLRVRRYQKQLQLGILSQPTIPHKDSTLVSWNTLSYDERRYWVKKMEVYAAMVDNLDQNVGRLIQYLKATHQYQNTLILFVSDNGAEGWDFSKLTMANPRLGGPVGTKNSNESYTKNWAQLSNVPWRSYKSTPYEGGLSSPCIASLPGVISRNMISHEAVHFIDFMPTLLRLADVKYPDTYHEVPTHILPGESFVPLLQGDTSWTRALPIFYEWAGQRMVRKGTYKAVALYPHLQWELYNITEDRSELKDLSRSHPEVVSELNTLYLSWAKENKVQEWDDAMTRKTGWRPDMFPHGLPQKLK